MTAISSPPLSPAPVPLGAQLMFWGPILLGLLALYLPTYYDLANGIWNTDDQAHGPIILVVTLYLIWTARQALLHPPAPGSAGYSPTRPLLGWPLLLLGLVTYALGRSQQVLMFEVGSQIPVLLGILLITRGFGALRALWFPLFFLVFMVPLPGFVVDALTVPLKQYVSVIAEYILHYAGYPIARSGVILTVGQYQMLVADACSGLYSMFSLSAMGLLYLYLIRNPSWVHNAILMASILPIAFAANIVRVMILVLVTFHLGDEAGQGFLHDFAGIILFVVALLMLFLLDWLLGFFTRKKPPHKPPTPSASQAPRIDTPAKA